MRRPDVIIIGGGIMGCSTGLALARAGLRPLILERAIPGAEASSAAAGMLAAQVHQAPGAMFDLGLRSRESYVEFVNELEELSGVDVGYHRRGVISLGESSAKYRWQVARGLLVEEIDGRTLRQLEPAVGGRHRRALLFPDEAQVDSPRLLRALSIAAKNAGCAFRRNARVTGIAAERGRVVGVDIEGRRLSTRTVVLAAGAWSSQVEGSGLRKDAIRPARGQMVAVSTPEPLLRHVVFAEKGYAVPCEDGRTLLGSTIEMAGFDKSVTVGGMIDVLGATRRAIPALSSASVTETWAGLRPYTKDHLPVLGAARTAGLYLNTGHFRGGILLAPASATALRELITTGDSSYDLGPFSPSRPLGR